jgi:hypothetical protein
MRPSLTLSVRLGRRLRPATWQIAAIAGLLALAAVGCTPQIGDSCALSTDCASDGTRVCDTSEPGGYCTILNCTGNELGSACPLGSICVQFGAAVPGCPYNAQQPSPVAQSFCMFGCGNNSDCRASYSCRSPSGPPWNAVILDPTQTSKVCMTDLWFIDGGVSPENQGYTGPLDAMSPVCQATGPSFDAGFPPDDASFDAGFDAGSDAGKHDAGKHDAGTRDASSDAKPDSTVHDGGLPDGAQHDGGSSDGAATDARADGAHDAGAG